MKGSDARANILLPMPQLTEADAYAIRQLYAQGELSYLKIARIYNVNKSLVGRIVRNEEWRTSSARVSSNW